MNKSFNIAIGISFLFIVAITTALKPSPDPYSYSLTEDARRQEIQIKTGDDLDMGFTKRALEKVAAKETLWHESASPIISTPIDESGRVGKDAYTFVVDQSSKYSGTGKETYVYRRNGRELFRHAIPMTAFEPIVEHHLVDGWPALTFVSLCDNDVAGCHLDTFYRGKLISQRFGVEDSRQLFSWHGKLGFITTLSGHDYVYFDGKTVSSGYDEIHTHNCCSLTEILPTVYDNGVLLFYAKQKDDNYLVELRLPE